MSCRRYRMSEKRWTFLVVGDEDSPVRQYSLSSRGLRVSLAVGGAVGVVLVALVLFLALGGAGWIQAERLQASNEALKDEITAFQDRVQGLEQTLDSLSSRDARYRSLAGLEPIDPEVMEVGVGGPGLESPEAHPLGSVDAASGEAAFALDWDLNALERRARLLSESLNEAHDSLQAHHDLLESTPSILPTSGWLSSGFSQSRMHPVHNRPLPHEGVDISAAKGTPIHAAAKGRIARAGWVAGYGLTVEIDHGYGYTTLYGHASKLLVRRGDRVQRGDVIAQVGSTGITTSSNVHYEVRVNGRPQNPANFILPDAVP